MIVLFASNFYQKMHINLIENPFFSIQAGDRLKPPSFIRSEKYFVLFFASFTAPNLATFALQKRRFCSCPGSRKIPCKCMVFFVVPRAGVEPATISLGRIYSIQLSYRGGYTGGITLRSVFEMNSKIHSSPKAGIYRDSVGTPYFSSPL